MKIDALKDKRICVGRVAALFGLKGEVLIQSFMNNPRDLGTLSPVFFEDGTIFSFQFLGLHKKRLRFKPEHADNCQEGGRLLKRFLYIRRAQLPSLAPESFYHADLIGLAARTLEGAPLGTVYAVHNFGAGDILEILPPKGASFYVTFHKDFVPAVRIEEGFLNLHPAALEREASP